MIRLLLAACLALSLGATGVEPVVEYRTFRVTPDTVRVDAGTTVRWVNRDQVLHTVTGGTPQEPIARSRLVMPRVGTSVGRTFKVPGTYRYFCDRHPFMTGTVIVTPAPR